MMMPACVPTSTQCAPDAMKPRGAYAQHVGAALGSSFTLTPSLRVRGSSPYSRLSTPHVMMRRLGADSGSSATAAATTPTTSLSCTLSASALGLMSATPMPLGAPPTGSALDSGSHALTDPPAYPATSDSCGMPRTPVTASATTLLLCADTQRPTGRSVDSATSRTTPSLHPRASTGEDSTCVSRSPPDWPPISRNATQVGARPSSSARGSSRTARLTRSTSSTRTSPTTSSSLCPRRPVRGAEVGCGAPVPLAMRWLAVSCAAATSASRNLTSLTFPVGVLLVVCGGSEELTVTAESLACTRASSASPDSSSSPTTPSCSSRISCCFS
mmetsp:Transcript_21566/g.54888  ORF Transcript_21566/g.54888 Transcript_21566/m.54888 type:complete len:329 (-) Transcript_21566:214-1200(-)